MAKASKHFDAKHPIYYQLNALIEAYKLLLISEDIKESKVKRYSEKKRALYRSSIITVCASWESFLEAAAETALRKIIADLKGPDQIPNNIKARIATRLIEKKNPLEIWKISGENWKQELFTNYELLIEKFNTPRPIQVDEFISKTLGLSNISKTWAWKGQSSTVSTKKLNEFMDLRGDIVHRVFPNRDIHAATISGYVNLLYRISCITSNEIRKHIHQLIGKYPWDETKVENLV